MLVENINAKIKILILQVLWAALEFTNKKMVNLLVAIWLLLNLSLARRVLDMDGLLAIAIDPCYISKAGKKIPHIGRF